MERTAPAPVGTKDRLIATFIDGAVLSPVIMAVERREGAGRLQRRVSAIVVRETFVVLSTALAGATPGQRAAGLRLFDQRTGGRASMSQVLRRSALRAAMASAPVLIGEVM